MNGRRAPSPSASLRIVLVLLLASLSLAVAPAGATGLKDSATTMWTRYWQCRVRATPSGTILTELDRNQEIRVVGNTVVHGARWDEVQLWGALHGWIEADLLAGAPLPVSFSSGGSVSPSPVGPHAPMPLHATAVTSGPATLRRAAKTSAPSVRSLRAGTRLSITRWATDSHGRAWYGLDTPAGTWVDADQVQLAGGRGTPSLDPLRGLGMWLTPAVLDIASPQAIVAAAAGSHVTHLYVEVAGSNDFYGAKVLEHLLPVAHGAHIAVLAWVYPYLDDVPKDVTIALQAADFVATTGDRPDGIAADVEQNMQEPYVRAYSQILRARLGPHALMIIAAYPPQSYWGELFPHGDAKLERRRAHGLLGREQDAPVGERSIRLRRDQHLGHPRRHARPRHAGRTGWPDVRRLRRRTAQPYRRGNTRRHPRRSGRQDDRHQLLRVESRHARRVGRAAHTLQILNRPRTQGYLAFGDDREGLSCCSTVTL